jgi:hypothetical protein
VGSNQKTKSDSPQHFMSLRDTPNYEKAQLFIAEIAEKNVEKNSG